MLSAHPAGEAGPLPYTDPETRISSYGDLELLVMRALDEAADPVAPRYSREPQRNFMRLNPDREIPEARF
jgi:hypothetical protein